MNFYIIALWYVSLSVLYLNLIPFGAPTPFRSPKQGEKRVLFGLANLIRFLSWPLVFAAGVAYGIPKIITWLLEPLDVEENDD